MNNVDYYIFYNEKIKDANDRPMVIITNEKEHYIFQIALVEYGFELKIIPNKSYFVLPQKSITWVAGEAHMADSLMPVYEYNIAEEYERRFETAEILHRTRYGGVLLYE